MGASTVEQPGAYQISEKRGLGVSPSGAISQDTERLIPESQLKAIVEDIVKKTLAQMLGVNVTAAQPNQQWYDTEVAWSRLDLNSGEQLREMTRNGMLRIGVEVRDVRSPSSQIPRYQFHVEKCEARLAMPPEQRQIKKRKVAEL